MTRLIFVIQNKQVIRTSWNAVASLHPNTYLISSRQLQAQSVTNKPFFKGAMFLAEINYSTILKASHDIVQRSTSKETPLFVTNDEYCLECVRELNQHYGNPYHSKETLKAYLNKVTMKGKLLGSEISIPKFIHFPPQQRSSSEKASLVTASFTFPVVGKPTQEANNRGVAVLHSNEQLTNWFELYRNSDVEIEEFISGKMFHCNSIIHNNQLIVLTVGEYLNPCIEFSYGKPIGSIFLQKSCALYKEISNLNKKVLKQLGPLTNCVFHLELFQRSNGELVFLEVAARAPGGMLSRAASLVTGIDLEQLNFNLQINQHFSLQLSLTQKNSFWCWIPKRPGIVTSLKEPKLSSQATWEWYVTKKQAITKEEAENTPACGIIGWNHDFQQLHSDFIKLRDYALPVATTASDSSAIFKKGIGFFNRKNDPVTTEHTSSPSLISKL